MRRLRRRGKRTDAGGDPGRRLQLVSRLRLLPEGGYDQRVYDHGRYERQCDAHPRLYGAIADRRRSGRADGKAVCRSPPGKPARRAAEFWLPRPGADRRRQGRDFAEHRRRTERGRASAGRRFQRNRRPVPRSRELRVALVKERTERVTCGRFGFGSTERERPGDELRVHFRRRVQRSPLPAECSSERRGDRSAAVSSDRIENRPNVRDAHGPHPIRW